MFDVSRIAMHLIRASQRVANLLPTSWYAFLRVRWRRLRGLLPARIASERFEGVPGRIHVTDYMHLEGEVDRFAAVGQDAVRNLQASLRAGGRAWEDVHRCLDYGCGYGRVLRWLVGRGFEVVAADVNAQAVSFCAAEFASTPFLIPPNRNDWALPGKYDLIWVGSVLTHLTPEACRALLTRLANALTPIGLLVFTTHGDVSGSGKQYGKDIAKNANTIRNALAAGEVVFVGSRENPTWGQTFHPPEAVRATIEELGLRLLREAPRGWDDHQDVWTVENPGTATNQRQLLE